MADKIPAYIEARIRQRRPRISAIVPGSTPVIAFGDPRTARVATLGWNPSKIEFLSRHGIELTGNQRRFETFASLGTKDLSSASDDVVRRVFDGCKSYFSGNPYYWFNKFKLILDGVNSSFFNGTACHLDLVPWSTDPIWRGLPRDEQEHLMEADLPFLHEILHREKIQLVLLNGTGIMKARRRQLMGDFSAVDIQNPGAYSNFRWYDRGRCARNRLEYQSSVKPWRDARGDQDDCDSSSCKRASYRLPPGRTFMNVPKVVLVLVLLLIAGAAILFAMRRAAADGTSCKP